MRTTIVLVHGASAESASWDGVIEPLVAEGHRGSDGTTDLYIAADSFHDVFCQDVPASQAALMAATQRPVTQEALVEPSGDHALWNDASPSDRWAR